MDRNFGGVIWTNHALTRMRERGIKQGDVWVTFRRPNQSRFAQSQGAWIYYRDFGEVRIEVVAKQNEKKEWLILSVWSKLLDKKNQPPKKQSFFYQFIKSILKQITG